MLKIGYTGQVFQHESIVVSYLFSLEIIQPFDQTMSEFGSILPTLDKFFDNWENFVIFEWNFIQVHQFSLEVV